jgi:hypothetical protein
MTDIPQDVVEKVARRLAERNGYDPDGRADDFGLAFKGFAQGNLPCWRSFQNDATAAIQAMIDAGWKGPEK